MDNTFAYGKNPAPSFDKMPFFTMKYSDFGFTDLTPENIVKGYQNLEKTSWSNQEKFLSDRIGFDASNSSLFKEGLDKEMNWGLINGSKTNAKGFYCQALRAKTGKDITECLSEALLSDKREEISQEREDETEILIE